jgi:hypothetical protein
MATGIVYLDVDDEITSAASRIRSVEGRRVALVLPYGSRVATSRINFRLLSRDALINEKQLSVVAGDSATRALAASAGLPVFGSVGEYETSLAGLDEGRATPPPTPPLTPPTSPPGTTARTTRRRAKAKDGESGDASTGEGKDGAGAAASAEPPLPSPCLLPIGRRDAGRCLAVDWQAVAPRPNPQSDATKPSRWTTRPCRSRPLALDGPIPIPCAMSPARGTWPAPTISRPPGRDRDAHHASR